MTKQKQLREHSDNAELKLNIKIKNASDNFCIDLINIVSLSITCEIKRRFDPAKDQESPRDLKGNSLWVSSYRDRINVNTW